MYYIVKRGDLLEYGAEKAGRRGRFECRRIEGMEVEV